MYSASPVTSVCCSVCVRILFRWVRDTSWVHSDHLFILTVLSPGKRHFTYYIALPHSSFPPSHLPWLFFPQKKIQTRKDTEKEKAETGGDGEEVWNALNMKLNVTQPVLVQRKISLSMRMFFSDGIWLSFLFASGSINLSISFSESLILALTCSLYLALFFTCEKKISLFSHYLCISILTHFLPAIKPLPQLVLLQGLGMICYWAMEKMMFKH